MSATICSFKRKSGLTVYLRDTNTNRARKFVKVAGLVFTSAGLLGELPCGANLSTAEHEKLKR